MRTKFRIVLIVAVLLLPAVIVSTSHAALQKVGSVDPENGFPAWYQDASGLSLAPCFDNNGFCPSTMFVGNGPGFDPNQPVVFPTNFPLVFFYFKADAFANTVHYTAALEGAFSNGVVRDGDQVTFARLMIRDAAAPDGTYTVTHPYGVDTILAAGNGVNFIEDIGLSPGIFTGALQGRIGPFLQPSTGRITSPDGKVYIGNGVTPVTVTGTAVTSVTVAGPISASTNTFILEGKVISMSITPTSVDFPAQRPAPVASAPVAMTVTNVSATSTLTITAITLQGTNAADFQVVDVNCLAAPVAANGTCTFNVIFSGAAAGPAVRTASVVVSAVLAAVPNILLTLATGIIDSVSPTIVSTFPADGQNVPLNSVITAIFSEPIATTTVNGTTFTVTGSGGPVTGSVTFDTVNNTAMFTPDANFISNQTFTATITTGVTDVAGNPLAADKTWSFTAAPPDTTPPTIVAASPANNAVGVRTDQPITVTFSEPMLSTSITGSVMRVTSGGVVVDGTVTVNGNVATLTPAQPLAFGTVYTVTVTTGAMDLASNALVAGQVINFITNFAPSVPGLVSPADGASGLLSTVTLTWTKATDDDGDPLTYQVFLCSNPFFIGCNAFVVTASAPRLSGVYIAGLSGLGMAVFGLISIGGIKGKKRFILALAVTVTTGALIYSCGEGKGDGSDSTPPTVPAGVTATAVSARQIDLTWTASTDNVGVTGYAIFSGDIFLTSVPTRTSLSVTGLSTSTNYCYTVNAHDAAGNESVQSDPACATTQSGPVAPSNQLTFTVGGLTPAALYFWKVAADDGKGGVIFSETRSFRTQ